MRILLASSEVQPFSKTGGLADMVGALAKTLAKAGHRVGVVTPLYRGILEKHPKARRSEWQPDLTLGQRNVQSEIWTLDWLEGLTLYFVDQPEFFDRTGLYQEKGVDYPDNAARFIYFSKALAHLARIIPWQPEVVHVHDWQAALACLLIRHAALREGWGTAPPTCLTIHNLAYQGVFPAWEFELTNLPWDYFNSEGVEFYGQLNCLKAGIVYADTITTVSPRYAREITTEEFGCGLDGCMRNRRTELHGILNGVDYEEWNTNNNPHLANAYSWDNLAGKAAEKLSLQQDLGLAVNPDIPLFGSITRLVEQKGVDIFLSALEEMLFSEMQLVVLGSGSPPFELAFQSLASRFPERVAVRIGYDAKLAHRIEAASDFFLMPSRFEPCGLNQMYSLRYGTIPVVRATGGLDDTVVDITENSEKANGIKFFEYSPRALAKAIRKALELHKAPDLLEFYRRNGMRADFSWTPTVDEYTKVYEDVSIGRRR